MKILVVEDNDLKYRRLLEVLASCGLSSENVTRSKNQRSALINLRLHHDFVLLDMTFEVLENKSQTATLQALAGLQVMQYMRRTGLQTPTVVVTQHSSFQQPGTPVIPDIETLDTVLKTNFPGLYRGYVFMTETNDWREVLISHLRSLNG